MTAALRHRPLIRSFGVAIATILALVCTAGMAAEPAVTPVSQIVPSPAQALASGATSDLLRWLIVESLPQTYEKSDNWGAKHAPLVKNNFKLDGLKLRKEPRTVEVNHGLWRKYRITPVDPEKELKLRVENVRSLAPGRTAFQTYVITKLRTEAQQERWRYGVKLLNFDLEADAVVEIRLDLELGIQSVPGTLVHDIVLDPRVTGAGLKLVSLDLDHIGMIDGDVAKELGKLAEGVVAKELRDREPKLVEKLNKAIDKRRDQLRFSPSQWISSGWAAARDALKLDEAK